MIGSAGARGPAERVTNGAGKQRETNCCGILRVLSRHTPIVSSPGGTGTLSIASRTFIPVYICQATSTKPHFQQSTLLPSHTYIKHLDTIHYRWHPMGHTSRSCQMFIWAFRVIFFIKLNVWNVYFSCTVVWIQDMELVISLLRIISSISASFLLIGPGAQMKRMNQFRRTITIWLPALQ